MLGIFFGDFNPTIAEKLCVPVQEGIRLVWHDLLLGAVLAVLAPFADLAPEIRAVDPRALRSAKGGTGAPVPPKTGR
jgi:hypothetical protein